MSINYTVQHTGYKYVNHVKRIVLSISGAVLLIRITGYGAAPGQNSLHPSQLYKQVGGLWCYPSIVMSVL